MSSIREQLEQVRTYVKSGDIEAARQLLESLADENPTALRWLQELNQHYPPAPKLFESDSHDKRLLRAQALLQKGDYREARWVLAEIQHIPQAREWLSALDELENRQRLQRKAQALQARYHPNSPLQWLGDFVRSSAYTSGIGTVLTFMGVIVIGLWLIASWVEGEGIFPNSAGSCTAPQLFVGETQCQLLGFIDGDLLAKGSTGFVSVRWVDRLVILIPTAAILLIVFGWLYAARRIDPLTAHIVFIAAAAILLGFPYFWESTSLSIASAYDPRYQAIIEASHSVSEFKQAGWIVASFVGIISVLSALEGMGALGIALNKDSLLNPELIDPSSSGEFRATIFERGRQKHRP